MKANQPMSKACFAILALACIAWCQAPGCSDDFSNPDVGGGKTWKFVDADSSVSGAATVAGGMLDLSGRGADIYGKRNQFVAVDRQDVKGDFDVSVKITSQTNSNGWAQAGILIANNTEKLAEGGYFVLDVSPANGQNVFYDAKDSLGQLESRVGTVGKTAYPVWLRVKKSNKKFSAWYKNAEADAWKVVAENIAPQGTLADSHIALISVSHNVDMDAHTLFDDFTCLNGTATGLRAYPPLPESVRSPMKEAVNALGRSAPEATGFLWKRKG